MSNVTKYIDSMVADVGDQDNRWTHEQVQEWATEYWRIRHDKSLTEDQMKDKIAAHYGRGKLERNVSTNDRGNTVVRRHWSTERYTFDFDDEFRADGWLQFDTNQDAWYFGVWVNPKRLMTLAYAEGDVTLVICPDAEHYNAEIKDACEFYGEGFEMIACNVEGFQSLMLGGEVEGADGTVYRQDRRKFFV